MLKRFGISLESDLSDQFDEYIRERGYTNRSEAIRDLIRDALIKRLWSEGEAEAAGAAVIVYNHHLHELSKKLTDIQHDHFELVVSTMHVHLDHYNCLEVVLLKGKAKEIRKLADTLIAVRGVKHGQFVGSLSGDIP
ncbi:MAG TPA: nickel-responsive transcriptional regulator NikR [Spirochaetia bacterium]|nr:nickel-responsive transcriptional regulator NikR [Spirochaetia bacterium]